MIEYAGISSEDVRVVVEHYPRRIVPQRRVRVTSIPGRNGDLIEDLGAYEGYLQPYDIYVSAEAYGLPRVARRAADWLALPRGYQKLYDSYEADSYRRAIYEGPADLENVLNLFGRATITFRCDPRRFMLIGDQPLEITESGYVLQNPTEHTALPLIRIKGSGTGAVEVGGVTITLTAIPDGLTVDSELMDTYATNPNAAQYVAFTPAHVYPTLPPGETTINFSGGVTGLEIIPRWWHL